MSVILLLIRALRKSERAYHKICPFKNQSLSLSSEDDEIPPSSATVF